MDIKSTTKRTWLATGACIVLAGCGASASRAAVVGAGAGSPLDTDRDTDWRRVATVADRARLRGWRGAWVDALAQVDRHELATDPILFDPDHALADALPPEGSYRCRTFKLGARGGVGPTYSASAWFACRIDSSGGTDVISLVKVDGSQRPVGTVFADTASRAVFLGTMELGDEKRPMRYGRDANRDMAGLIERIGTQRWRVVLPYPRFESVLDVVELVPAA
ncbi:hypothetical protein HMP09_0300 [Sphingomonas sp. HMP9]|uniref:DUF4893 domain-containing protein n=1 Tax=Sphingomonas sp. HMP9 TaxID=1517554 RepID=UPI0015965706|nr:DUF4893 domain-containing protein [Sphingomonas sp. HMP9]BCA61066.1 hypothetical protein HMP09_0300 [Sphingomonas sp. HMP9]